ncbi:hypothetical protein BH20ACT2_BH20ACT2_20110 [soil metagenome]
MDLLLFLLLLAIQGLVIGALGRLAIPGPNPMSLGRTALIGIAGSFLGGLAGYFIFDDGRYGFLLGVLGAALIVWLTERGRRPRR